MVNRKFRKMKKLVEIARSLHVDIIMDIATALVEENIQFNVENTKPAFDITFTGGGALTEYILKVEEKDAEKAFEILDKYLEANEEEANDILTSGEKPNN